ncbi:unnamed protein product, partial [Amoebophrya sp. A25]|eukprot:GSA25T00023005001.1
MGSVKEGQRAGASTSKSNISSSKTRSAEGFMSSSSAPTTSTKKAKPKRKPVTPENTPPFVRQRGEHFLDLTSERGRIPTILVEMDDFRRPLQKDVYLFVRVVSPPMAEDDEDELELTQREQKGNYNEQQEGFDFGFFQNFGGQQDEERIAIIEQRRHISELVCFVKIPVVVATGVGTGAAERGGKGGTSSAYAFGVENSIG